MSDNNIQGEIRMEVPYLRNKYWFIGSALFFLLAASVYLIFTSPKYKVTTSIVLNDQNSENIITDIKSKLLVEEVIERLPLKVSYYRKEKEIGVDSLPFKFVLIKSYTINSQAQLVITILDGRRYEIDQNDTLTEHFFNEPVYYPFAKFEVVKSTASNTVNKPVTLKFNNADQIFKEYYTNLNAKFSDVNHKAIELSLTTTSLKKGRAFLNKLVEVYNSHHAIANMPTVPATASGNKMLEKIGDELSVLKSKIKELKEQQIALKNYKEKQTSNIVVSDRNNAELNAINAITPYAQSPVSQFSLIPDSYQVTDNQLKELIVRFNKKEWDRQHALQNSSVNIAGINQQLATIKQTILQRIDIDKSEITHVQPSFTGNGQLLAANLQDSISKIDNLVKSKQLEYTNLLKNDSIRGQVKAVNAPTIIKNPDEHVTIYPKIGYVYLFALLAGFALPLIIQYLIFPFIQIINTKKLEEKTIMR